ncbi:ARM repeat-containing protein [Artomyces pyxidatus]|uniref:ARM repeat-containing protein n=1 Tax=Artomyces pyxidatus TaxID=48021 RepID=A0ACB8TK46_9AGAM|nr:ARM repeat-containing protein [Artomyces pyxidatus]
MNVDPQNAPTLSAISQQQLYIVVSAAASQNPSEMLAASTRLKELLEQPGTLNVLHEISAQKSIPLPIRQLCIIQIKNVVMNHWRSRRLIPDHERPAIRARCITFLDEEDDTISRCNEIIVAKIARSDFPQKWPSLESDLMTPVTNNLGLRQASTGSDPHSSRILHRSLRLLNALLKEFSRTKMMTSAKTLSQLIDRLHLVLSDHYVKIAEGLSASLTVVNLSNPRTADDLLFAHLLFKCIMKMAVWIWPRLRDTYSRLQPWFTQAFQSSAIQLRSLYEIRIALISAVRVSNVQPDPTATRSLDLLTRYVRTLGKFFRRVQQLDVHRFVALPACDDLVSYYWDKVVQANTSPELIADSPQAVYPVRFLVQGMVLFKESLSQWSPTRKVKSGSGTTLPQDFVENAVTFLVTRFMPLNPSDLEGWMADPEEWVNGEDKEDEQWEFELRPCAERVLMTFSNQYQQYVTPLLVAAFNKVNGSCLVASRDFPRPTIELLAQPGNDLPAIIQKEAVYSAVGRCANRLKEHIDFGQWLDLAASEANNPNADYLILKRRIVWLIGKWVSDGCYPPTDVRVWQILVHLLSDRGTGTEVVRLTSASALQDSVNVLNFNVEAFVPFLGQTISELMQLIAEVESMESKRKLATCLNTVIERAGDKIVPYVSVITSPLPHLWLSAGEEILFKNTLLHLVTTLITAIGENSASLSGIVVPLIQESFLPGLAVQLDDDALKLWIAALRNASTLDSVAGGPGLLDLFPLAIKLLSENLDLLGKLTTILEGYFLLNSTAVLARHAVQLFPAFLRATEQALPANVKHLLIALEILFQMAHPSAYAEALHLSGLFASFMKTLTDENDKGDALILTHHILIMARIAVVDRQSFVQLISATAISQNISENSLWETLLDQWWRRFDNLSEPRHRKLSAMGIAALVSTGRPEVLQRLHSEIFALWMDVFAELKEIVNRDKDGTSGDAGLTLYWDQPADSYYNGAEDTLEYERRRSAYDNDITRTTLLSSFVAARLQEAEVACGGTQIMQAEYLAKTDPIVLKQIMTDVFGKH